MSRGEQLHAFPKFLPDGRHILYVSGEGRNGGALHVASLDSEEPRLVAAGSFSNVSYAPPGYLLFVRAGALVAQRFDDERLTLEGDPVGVTDAVQQGLTLFGGAVAGFSVSRTGVLAYQNRSSSRSQLLLVDRNGKTLSEVSEPGIYSTMALSPDGGRIAVGKMDPQTGAVNLWVIDLVRHVSFRLTFGSVRESDGAWSPDGSRVAYNASRDGVNTLYEIAATGGQETALMPPPATRPAVDHWSADGRFVLYHHLDARELLALPMSGDRTPIPVVKTPSGQLDEANFSPDSRFVAYNSTESGKAEVFVVPFPPTGAKWQISSGGGAQPRRRGDGRELFYLSLDGTIMAVDTQLGTAATAGAPRPLFQTGISVSPQLDQYAVTRDGQRFIIMKPIANTAPTGLTVVVNWPSLLKP